MVFARKNPKQDPSKKNYLRQSQAFMLLQLHGKNKHTLITQYLYITSRVSKNEWALVFATVMLLMLVFYNS